MTSTLGSTSHIANTAQATSGSSDSNVASPLTMTEGGQVTYVSVYMAGYGGSCSTRCVLWNTSGTRLAYSGAFTAASAAFSVGNSLHYNKAMSTPYDATSGTTYRCGFGRTSSGDGFQWDRDTGGTTYVGDGLSGNMTGTTTDSTQKINVYITYETVPEVWIRRAGAWVKCSDVVVRRASAWVSIGPECYVRRAGAWVKVD